MTMQQMKKDYQLLDLNFPNNANYDSKQDNKTNIAPFELTAYLLGQYNTVKEVKKALMEISIYSEVFNEYIPLTSLH